MAFKEGKVEQTEKFIREWDNHECMWNVHHPSYHNRDERTAAEKVIASIMDMTVKEVKNKAHNLRTYFVKELANINFNKPTGTGTDDAEPQTSK